MKEIVGYENLLEVLEMKKYIVQSYISITEMKRSKITEKFHI